MNGMLSVFPYLGLAYTLYISDKYKAKKIFLTPVVLFKKTVILLLHVSGDFISKTFLKLSINFDFILFPEL